MADDLLLGSDVVVDEPYDDYNAGRFHIRLVPQPNATPTELMQLGVAIQRFRHWAGRQTGRRKFPFFRSVQQSPRPATVPHPDTDRGWRPRPLPPTFLRELLAGRQPSRPIDLGFTLRHLSPPLEPAPPASSIGVCIRRLRRFCGPGRPYQRWEFIEALFYLLPADAIQDIVVDGRSWREID
jgi:hypothetical protein